MNECPACGAEIGEGVPHACPPAADGYDAWCVANGQLVHDADGAVR